MNDLSIWTPRGAFEALKMEIRTKTIGSYANLKKRTQLEIIEELPYNNIYYCCTQKTASQWFKKIFDDPVFYQYTGFVTRPYNKLGLKYASIKGRLPDRTIATHLYISHSTFKAIPKLRKYKAFFILRDPRDVVVSWYFSAKKSHVLVDPIPHLRQNLESLNLQEGIKYMIDRLQEFGSFDTQKSWVLNKSNSNGEFEVFRYEDFSSDNYLFMRKLFQYLDVDMPESKFDNLLERCAFKRLSGGRQQGKEDANSHYRKGIPGDWENYFDSSISTYFRDVTGDLLDVLGYS